MRSLAESARSWAWPALINVLAFCAGAQAAGIESLNIEPPSLPEFGKAMAAKSSAALQEAEDSFQNSELLAKLKAQSAENKEKCVSTLRSIQFRLGKALNATMISLHILEVAFIRALNAGTEKL
jgi:hypothetical protein